MENINTILKKDFSDLKDSDVKKILGVLNERLMMESARKDKSGIYGYNQQKTAYHSNRMEGSTLTESQTALLFETGALMADGGEIFRSRDIEEANGHFAMFHHMLQTAQDPLTEALIKQYHYNLKIGVFDDRNAGYIAGEYKKLKNTVLDITTAAPDTVPDRMNELLVEYEKEDMVTLATLADLHILYETIHPFQNGNGPTGRIIIFKECLRKNIIPFILEETDKLEYYNALRYASKDNDSGKLEALYKKSQEKYYNVLREYLTIHNPKTTKISK